MPEVQKPSIDQAVKEIEKEQSAPTPADKNVKNGPEVIDMGMSGIVSSSKIILEMDCEKSSFSFDPVDVFSNLQSIKVGIFNKQKQLLTTEREIALLKSDLKMIAENVDVQVLSELDEKGKPLHSNAQKREIAANQLLNDMPQYSMLVKRRDELLDSQQRVKFEYDSLKADFDSWRIASRFLGV